MELGIVLHLQIVSAMLVSSVLNISSAVPVENRDRSIKTGLRWEVRESDGRIVRSLSDSQHIITLEYNQKGQLIQCWQTKQGKSGDAIALLFYAAMADKVASKDAVMIDIPAVMKACKSYMKKIYQADTKKSAEIKSDNKQLQEQIETVDILREGFDGSKWCGLMPKKSKAKALKKEDRCCKKWHHCETSIASYSYDFMMYNYHPYQLMGCNCTLELEQCLRDQTTSVLAEEIVETMFDQSDLRCLHLEKREENCVEWDDFFNRCKKNTWASFAKIITLSQYKTLMEIDEKTLKKSSDDKSSTGGSNDADVEPSRHEL